MSTNIDYWKKVLDDPMPSYQKLFLEEAKYLKKHIVQDASVLDVCCGNGRSIEFMSPLTNHITGIDTDNEVVFETREKFQHIRGVNIVGGSIFSLPFPEKSFDVVTLFVTLGNFAKKKVDALSEMKRVMKDGGKIILSVYSEDALNARLEQYRRIQIPIKEINQTTVVFELSEETPSEQFSLEELRVLGEQADLKIVDSVKIGDIAYIVTYQK